MENSFIYFLMGTIECFPGGSILYNKMFSRWLIIARYKVFQMAQYCKMESFPGGFIFYFTWKEGVTYWGQNTFDLIVTALNVGAFYEPTRKFPWKVFFHAQLFSHVNDGWLLSTQATSAVYPTPGIFIFLVLYKNPRSLLFILSQ